MKTSTSNHWIKIENWYLSDKVYRSFMTIMIPLTIVLLYLSIEKLSGRTLVFQDKNTTHFLELENEHLKAEIKSLKNEVAKSNLLLNYYGVTVSKQN